MRSRTLFLTERTPAEYHLAPADVEFLLTTHRPHLELLPTRCRHRYRLTPAGHVGVIFAPSVRLVIRPKVPVRNLFYLLDPAADFPVTDDSTTATPGTEALDFLAARLARLLAERSRAGLHRAYAERADSGPFLQGRLDVPAQLRDPAGRKDALHCRYEDFTVDVPCNQVGKATALLLVRSPLVAEGVRAGLRQALLGYEGVRPVPLGPDCFAAAAPDRLTEAYRPLLELCRLLADSLDPGAHAGADAGPAFLLDLERVFERYLTAGLVRAFAGRPGYGVAVGPLYHASPPTPGRPDFTVRPDVTVSRRGSLALVVDAKWKRLPRTSLVTADAYQALAYCAALGVGRAALVYPGRRDRVRDYPLAGSPVRLRVHTLRVTGGRDECARSLARLGRALGRWCREEGPAA
jgi:5-methylcytosine-specific restriction enzyme subunit McrC